MAKRILMEGAQKTAIVLGLEGNLGSGKTTFLQGFARGLGVKQKISSPTFVIMRKYKIFNFQLPRLFEGSAFKRFYHIDCYRLKKPEEIFDLGFKKIIKNPKNIVAIEWLEKIEKIMSRNKISIKFKFLGKKERKITINMVK